MPTPARRLFDALSPGSERNLLDTLREERVGGALLLAGTVVALLWANIAPASYTAVSDTVVGPAALHLDLTLATWATDGLLAIFFFVVGLELKREIVAGELRNPRTAVVPIVAAVGGMVVPAALYLAVNLTSPDGNARGWAVPTATDIAFAVSVLAIVGRSLPNALRAFLLTLAVVDDLLAIIVIGAVYTESVSALWLGVGAATVVVFALVDPAGLGQRLAAGARSAWSRGLPCTRPASTRRSPVSPSGSSSRRRRRPPGGRSGSTPCRRSRSRNGGSTCGGRCPRGSPCPCSRCSPPGSRSAPGPLATTFADPVAQGVALGLVVGKPLGILGATWLVARFTRAALAPGLGWAGRRSGRPARRDRVHRVAAGGRARVRRRQPARRARRRLGARRVAGRGRPRRRRPVPARPTSRARGRRGLTRHRPSG